MSSLALALSADGEAYAYTYGRHFQDLCPGVRALSLAETLALIG